ncbi:MAG: helicase [Ignavibacteriae bacterium]|nr:helicase [Ignavibacteriota bacterium]NOH00280.1 helicase [Ignavibacteriota bacterium]
MAKVFHSEVFGLREQKYDWLNNNSIQSIEWNKLEPQKEFFLFIPQDQKLQKIYQSFEKITDIFPLNSVGVVTSRDSFVIDVDKKKLKKRIKQFLDKNFDNDLLKQTYGLKENKNWKIGERRIKLRKDEDWKKSITKILYRPFDVQWIFYNDEMIERSRKEIMQHMLEDNISLCFMRQVSSSEYFSQILVSKHMVDNRTFFSSRGIIQQAPLYIYPNMDKTDLFSEHESGEKKPNINPDLFEELKISYKKDITPEEIFYYIYSVLYSNIYRTKYAEFLKIDFPRVPFTKNYKLFTQFGKLGKQLADLHLLKSKTLEKTISKFPISGNNKVEKPRFDGAQRDDGKVWLNKEQYFDGIKEEVWEYQIGGYQVCSKWLKDRKGRILSLEEIQTYCKIVTSISKTIELQKDIDELYNILEQPGK